MTDVTKNEFCFTGSIFLENASSLLKAGREHLLVSKDKKEIVFDLRKVEETDSSALGVFFALLRTARDLSLTVRIVNPPTSMVRLADLYGVSDALPLADDTILT